MEHNQFRLRLNLFDGIVLVLALLVCAFLLLTTLNPAPAADEAAPSPQTTTVQYTVRFQRWLEGTSELIQPGDKLVDNIKNFEMGTVLSAQAVPVQSLQLDYRSEQFVLADLEGYEDVLVTVESPCTLSDEALTTSGGYTLRVGSTAYIRGQGYMASGPIISIDREGLK